MAKRRKRFRLMPIVITVILLVFLANFDSFENALGKVLGNDPVDHTQSQRPTATTAGNSTPQKDIVLAAVPEELRGNYFLAYKDVGCCKSFFGKIVISVIMVSDSVGQWDESSVASLRDNLNVYVQKIASEAAAYGVELNITLHYREAKLTGDICNGEYSDDWQDQALTSAGLPELERMHEYVTETYQAKEAPVLFAFNKLGRAYATVGGAEFFVLFNENDFNSFQHEISHIFGARDFYYPAEVEQIASDHFLNSVMNSGEGTDSLTAYLIGWTDSLTKSAQDFLKETNTITSEEMAAHRKNESFTGYGTKVFSNGTYTGDLVRGRRHGTGTMRYNDGGWYTGQWDNGAWSGIGEGKYYLSDGASCEGAFLNGKLHGQGTYTYADGSSYTGDWTDGKMNGIGTMRYADGGWYTGGYTDGIKSGTGQGKEIYSNGVYEGEFLDGKRHGQGTYSWNDGDVYTGSWENGTRSGYGTYTWASGNSKSGIWKDGSFVE